ncbi:hypothetical protein Dimus_029054 [Dionaea muscipula]
MDEEQNVEKDGEDDDIDEDDDMPLRSKIEAIRSDNTADDDDVLLSIKYQPVSQDLIPADADLEVAAVNNEDMEVEEPAVSESKLEDNSLIYFGPNGESFGIEDIDTYLNFVIEDAANKILEEVADKVEHEYVEELTRYPQGMEQAAPSTAHLEGRRLSCPRLELIAPHRAAARRSLLLAIAPTARQLLYSPCSSCLLAACGRWSLAQLHCCSLGYHRASLLAGLLPAMSYCSLPHGDEAVLMQLCMELVLNIELLAT